MAKVIDRFSTHLGVDRKGIKNVTTSTYTVEVDANGNPLYHLIRVYNACTITLPPVVDGAEIIIIARYAATPESSIILLLDDPATELIVGSTSYALTNDRETVTLIGDTYSATDEWVGA